MEVSGKIFIVTGGAQGIGRCIAEKFLENGAKYVIILDVKEEEGNKTINELNNKNGDARAVFLKCDVIKDLDKVYDEIVSSYKTVDVLVNNAGWVREKSIRDTFDLNAVAVVEWSMKFFEHMRTDKGGNGGTIMNMSSIYGYLPCSYAPFYTASKHAVQGFTKSKGDMRIFSKTGVRMVAICPGFVRTSLGQDDESIVKDEDFEKHLESRPWQDPISVGEAAVEVFKKASSGTAWLVDGGNPPEELA